MPVFYLRGGGAAPKMDDLMSTYQSRIQRLINVQTIFRWLFSLFLWLTIGAVCLWQIREPLVLIREFFTWAAVRIVFTYYFIPSLGLVFCLSISLATLIWQSQHILLGFSAREYRSMIKYIQQIEQTGKKHPLWRWVCEQP